MSKSRKQPDPGRAGKARRRPRRGTTARTVADAEAPPPPPAVSTLVPPGVELGPDPSADCEPPAPDGVYGLSVREADFVDAYLGACRGDAVAAARVAYRDGNPRVLAQLGFKILAKGRVQRAIQRRLIKGLGGPKWTKAGLVEIANGCMADLLDNAGHIDPAAVTAAAAWGLVEQWQEESTETAAGIVVTRRKVKLYSRLKALQTLAKLHGLLIDRQQVTGEVDHRHTLRDAAARVLAGGPEVYALARQLADRLAPPPPVRPVGAEQPTEEN